jgi:predicted nucleotidyltransferase
MKYLNRLRDRKVIVGARQMWNRFTESHPDKKIIFMCVAGSHFFEMNTKDSDLDFRGIYLPQDDKSSRRQEVTFKTREKEGRNTNKDIDCTFFSLSKFLYLLSRGDFNMLEILYAPKHVIVSDTELYQWLRRIRTVFISTNIKSFIGFIKKEYAKYGVNHDHFNAQTKLIEFLEKYPPNCRIKHIWEEMKEFAEIPNSLIRFTKSRTGHDVYVESFVIAQRLFQNTVTVDYILDALKTKVDNYGHRMKNRTDGADLKGLYHAQRLIYEALDIVKEGDLKIDPLPEERKKYLLKIKKGEIDVEELSNSINKDIDFLKNYDFFDERRRLYVEDVAERISYNINNEIRIRNLLKGGKHD